MGGGVGSTPPSLRQAATRISLGQPVAPPLEIVAHLLARTFHRWPWEIAQEPADAVLRAWQLEQDLAPKERR